MGTSTCDILVVPTTGKEIVVEGICGQVVGSVLPSMVGMEAGQSAFGDAYAWFRQLVSFPLNQLLKNPAVSDNSKLIEIIDEVNANIISDLSVQAAHLEINLDSEIALDWFNGRRTPNANQKLTAALAGLDLASDAASIFRAIVEATCFGAKAIVDCFINQGIPIKGLIGLGGVARKSPFIMQMMADVLNMPIRIHSSEQTCALGAAMFAATASGIYPDVQTAMKKMGPGFDKTFTPDQTRRNIYMERFKIYNNLGFFIENSNEAAEKEINLSLSEIAVLK